MHRSKRKRFLWTVEAGEELGGGGTPGTPPGGLEKPEDKPEDKPEPPAGEQTLDEEDPNYYPPNTAVADMTPTQQAAFYRHQWHKEKKIREDAAKAKAAEDEKARLAGMSEVERQIEEARAAGRAAAEAEFQVERVQMAFRANAGKLRPDEVESLLEGINPLAFVTEAGLPDTDKINRYMTPFRTSGGGGPREAYAGINDVDALMEKLKS